MVCKNCKEYKKYYDAVRKHHNGYNAEMRKENPYCKEPKSPYQAISSLLAEGESMLDSQIENNIEVCNAIEKYCVKVCKKNPCGNCPLATKDILNLRYPFGLVSKKFKKRGK